MRPKYLQQKTLQRRFTFEVERLKEGKINMFF